MRKRKLLDDISGESIEMMIPCFKPKFRNFESGEVICSYASEKPSRIAVISEGIASLEILNEDGDSFFIEDYEKGDVFGDLFSLPMENFQYVVTARNNCRVMYLDFDHVVTPCDRVCSHHSQLLTNLFMMTAQKSQELVMRLSILEQGSIRTKLMTYLRRIRKTSTAPEEPDAEFIIPMTLNRLADYIGADRSAMMRELRSMKSDGLIESHGRRFRILFQ